MRRRVFASLIVVIVLAGLLELTGLTAADARPSVEAGTSDPSDSPPPGYNSMAGVKLAIVLGQLKLINPRVEVPESVEVRRDIEYGKGGGESLKLDLFSPKTVKRPVPGPLSLRSTRGLAARDGPGRSRQPALPAVDDGVFQEAPAGALVRNWGRST